MTRYFLLAILLLPITAFAAWTGATSFETTDGSTAPTNGLVLTGTGDGTGWSGNWANGPIDGAGTTVYTNTQASDGTWSYMQDSYTAHTNNEEENLRALSSCAASGRISSHVRFNVSDRNNLYQILYDAASYPTGLGPFVEMTQTNTGARTITAYETGGTATTVASNVLSPNTWYTFDLDYDATTDTYDIYVDGTKQNHGAVNFRSSQTQICRTSYYTGAASGFSATLGSIFYVDDIKPYAAPATAITEFPLGLKASNIKSSNLK